MLFSGSGSAPPKKAANSGFLLAKKAANSGFLLVGIELGIQILTCPGFTLGLLPERRTYSYGYQIRIVEYNPLLTILKLGT